MLLRFKRDCLAEGVHVLQIPTLRRIVQEAEARLTLLNRWFLLSFCQFLSPVEVVAVSFTELAPSPGWDLEQYETARHEGNTMEVAQHVDVKVFEGTILTTTQQLMRPE